MNYYAGHMYSGMHNGVRPSDRLSVCPVSILTATHHGAACDAASVYFGLTTRRTDIFVDCYISWALGSTMYLGPDMRVRGV